MIARTPISPSSLVRKLAFFSDGKETYGVIPRLNMEGRRRDNGWNDGDWLVRERSRRVDEQCLDAFDVRVQRPIVTSDLVELATYSHLGKRHVCVYDTGLASEDFEIVDVLSRNASYLGSTFVGHTRNGACRTRKLANILVKERKWVLKCSIAAFEISNDNSWRSHSTRTAERVAIDVSMSAWSSWVRGA